MSDPRGNEAAQTSAAIAGTAYQEGWNDCNDVLKTMMLKMLGGERQRGQKIMTIDELERWVQTITAWNVKR